MDEPTKKLTSRRDVLKFIAAFTGAITVNAPIGVLDVEKYVYVLRFR